MASSIPTSIKAYLPEMPRREALVAAGGAVSYAALGVLEDFLDEHAYDWASSTLLGKVISNALPITTFITTIGTVYSTYKLCQKVVVEKQDLKISGTATALGVLATAVAGVVFEYFYDRAWDLYFDVGYSKLTWAVVHMGCDASAIVGVSLTVFTLYAAYSFGKLALATPEESE